MMERRNIFTFFGVLLAAAGKAQAIAVIPPAAYVVTLSLGALLANAALMLAGWAVVLGLAGRQKTGGLSLSEILALCFDWAGRLAVAMAAIALVGSVLHPVSVLSATVAGIIASAVCVTVLFLTSFRERLAWGAEERARHLQSMVVFCVLVFLTFTLGTLLALQARPLFGTPGARDAQAVQAPGIAAPLQRPAADVPAASVGPQREAGEVTLYVQPVRDGTCTVTITDKSFSFESSHTCTDDGNVLSLGYCPVGIPLGQFPDGTYTVAGLGSCEDRSTLRVFGGIAEMVG